MNHIGVDASGAPALQTTGGARILSPRVLDMSASARVGSPTHDESVQQLVPNQQSYKPAVCSATLPTLLTTLATLYNPLSPLQNNNLTHLIGQQMPRWQVQVQQMQMQQIQMQQRGIVCKPCQKHKSLAKPEHANSIAKRRGPMVSFVGTPVPIDLRGSAFGYTNSTEATHQSSCVCFRMRCAS